MTHSKIALPARWTGQANKRRPPHLQQKANSFLKLCGQAILAHTPSPLNKANLTCNSSSRRLHRPANSAGSCSKQFPFSTSFSSAWSLPMEGGRQPSWFPCSEQCTRAGLAGWHCGLWQDWEAPAARTSGLQMHKVNPDLINASPHQSQSLHCMPTCLSSNGSGCPKLAVDLPLPWQKRLRQLSRWSTSHCTGCCGQSATPTSRHKIFSTCNSLGLPIAAAWLQHPADLHPSKAGYKLGPTL